jgi:hypothetical protein
VQQIGDAAVQRITAQSALGCDAANERVVMWRYDPRR